MATTLYIEIFQSHNGWWKWVVSEREKYTRHNRSWGEGNYASAEIALTKALAMRDKVLRGEEI